MFQGVCTHLQVLMGQAPWQSPASQTSILADLTSQLSNVHAANVDGHGAMANTHGGSGLVFSTD